ncbi:molybdopterin-binding protein [Nonomuraea sp. NPDC048916]|uniref:molybdopterin molybdotransferase MoeA n=1 Tax=Nonomuraea sp. NPDC048916 TaxID=3154232 RepID=UPI0033C203F4
MRNTSTPALCRAAPTYAPMAPAPRTATFTDTSVLASYCAFGIQYGKMPVKEPPMTVAGHEPDLKPGTHACGGATGPADLDGSGGIDNAGGADGPVEQVGPVELVEQAGPVGPVGPVGWEVARRIAAGAARPRAVVEAPLPEAQGCRLAVPLRALVAVPGADVAAMDGYAVAGPPPWRVAGQVLAGGRPYGDPLRAGEAVEIATGAPVPMGTTAVLPYEDAVLLPAPDAAAPACEDAGSPPGAGRTVPCEGAGRVPGVGRMMPSREDAGSPPGAGRTVPYEGVGRVVRARGEIAAGRHVRRRGEDIAEGAVVLEPGAVVTPVVLGLAAGLGHDVLRVRPRPAVTVLVTGDEVVDAGLPEPGRVRDAIGPFLPGLVEWAGGRVTGGIRLPDGADPLRAALAASAGPRAAAAPRAAAGPLGATAPRAAPDGAASSGGVALSDGAEADDAGSAGDGMGGVVDVVVVCGASSRGPADHLRAVLAELGAEVLVDGVAVRPGHPQLLARLRAGPLVVGLPGNPYAALGAALTLLVPVLGRLTGTERGRETGALAGPVGAHPHDIRPVAVLRTGAAGSVRAHPHDTRLVAVRRTGGGVVPVGHDRPGSLWGAALADALAVVPPGWNGERVELLELPGGLDRPFTTG